MLRFDGYNEWRSAPVITDKESPWYNVDKIALSLHHYLQVDRNVFRTKQIAYIIGEDFAWDNAFYDFFNLDAIVEYMNNDETYKKMYRFRYSTPTEFVDSIYNEKERLDVQKTEKGDEDMLPYADIDSRTSKVSYWTGFYSSRPNFKK